MTTTAEESGRARVARLRIEKFRAIGSAEIESGDMVALVGQNGAGKSSVLRALNAFFNFEAERDAFKVGLHRYSSTTQSISGWRLRICLRRGREAIAGSSAVAA